MEDMSRAGNALGGRSTTDPGLPVTPDFRVEGTMMGDGGGAHALQGRAGVRGRTPKD